MSLLRQSPAKPTLLSRSPRNLTFVAKPITLQLLLSPRPAVRRGTMSSVFLVPSGQRPHRQLVRLRALHMVTGCTKASSRNHNHASPLPCHPHCWLWPKHHQFLPQRLPTGKLLAPKQIGQIPASSLTPKHRALSTANPTLHANSRVSTIFCFFPVSSPCLLGRSGCVGLDPSRRQ